MDESEAGIQDNNEDLKPGSRRERISKYLIEKEKFNWSQKWIRKKPPAVAIRLERRAKQRAFRKMTPEEQAKYREHGNHRTKRLAWTTIAGHKNYTWILDRWVSIRKEPLFKPTAKFKVNTGKEGKGSWKVDYSPSVIDTVAGKCCPAAIADKSETHKHTVLKKKNYQRGTGPRHKEKFIKQEEPNWIDKGDYILVPIEPEKKKKVKDAEPELEVKDCEVKLRRAIDGLDQKSTNGRAESFSALQTTLSQHLMPDVVTNNRATIADALVRALKKGRTAEKLAAARLAPILCIQLGESHSEEFVNGVKSAFTNIMTDKAIDPRIQAVCCQSLAAISVLSRTDMLEIIDLMRTYETIFSRSYSKSSFTHERADAESVLQTAALNAWSMLLAVCSPADVHSLLNGTTSTLSLSLLKLTELLQASSVELRTAAGIGLSLAYELGIQYSEEFGRDELNTVIAEVEQLDSQKFRAKKDRKIQRGTFRKVLRSLEEKRAPMERVHLGSELLELERWSSHVLYRRLAAALGSGLRVAGGTSLLRSALRIPPSVCHDAPETKQNKQEKHRHFAKTSKARSISRKMDRDKRYVDFDL